MIGALAFRAVAMRVTLVAIGIAVGCGGSVAAEARFTITNTAEGVSVAVDKKPFAGYVINQGNKPFLWPVYGPTGRPLTRAYPMEDLPGEPGAQRDHPHHRGITFGHESINGIDTWHERATFEESIRKGGTHAVQATQLQDRLGSIRHRAFATLDANDDRAVVAEVCDHCDAAGRRILTEERRLTFRTQGPLRFIDFDQDLVASDGDLRIDDRKDAGLLIRVPTSMAVDMKEGGRIVNAEGATDKDAWSQRSAWVDYHGTVDGEHLGIAILNHPASFRHPTGWHVRTYGLFTANPFTAFGRDGANPPPLVLKAGERLKLRHRFVLHEGDAAAADIPAAYRTYASEAKD